MWAFSCDVGECKGIILLVDVGHGNGLEPVLQVG